MRYEDGREVPVLRKTDPLDPDEVGRGRAVRSGAGTLQAGRGRRSYAGDAGRRGGQGQGEHAREFDGRGVRIALRDVHENNGGRSEAAVRRANEDGSMTTCSNCYYAKPSHRTKYRWCARELRLVPPNRAICGLYRRATAMRPARAVAEAGASGATREEGDEAQRVQTGA